VFFGSSARALPAHFSASFEEHEPPRRGGLAFGRRLEELHPGGRRQLHDLLLFGLDEHRQRRHGKESRLGHLPEEQRLKGSPNRGLQTWLRIRRESTFDFDELLNRPGDIAGLSRRLLRERQPDERFRKHRRLAQVPEGSNSKLVDRLEVLLLVVKVLPGLQPGPVEVVFRRLSAQPGGRADRDCG
jgi:hypothetical protein